MVSVNMSVSILRVPSTVTVVVVICWRVTTVHVKVMRIIRPLQAESILHVLY